MYNPLKNDDPEAVEMKQAMITKKIKKENIALYKEYKL